MKWTDLSPSRLIAGCFAGYLIAISGFALLSSRTFVDPAHHVGFLVYLIVCLFLILPGVILSYKAATLLEDGVRLERWTQDELRTVRRMIDHPAWLVISWSMVAVAAGVLALAIIYRRQGLDFFYLPILYCTYCFLGIRRSLKEPHSSQLPPPRVIAARLQ